MRGFSLLIIDPQVDFHEGGSLAVPGAAEDAKRIAEFISWCEGSIEEVFVTMDCHQPNHIAHARVWTDENGNEPPAFQQIRYADVGSGVWRPKDPSLLEHCKHYTRELERSGAFVLTIWPEHCIKGSAGYEVVPELQTALRSWSDRQGKAVRFVNKGMNELTEMYSALQAELPMVDDPSTQLNTELIDQLRQSNKLVVCGQALSHCVNWTVRHLVSHWSSRDPADIIILTDGSSAVPGCEKAANDFLGDMRAAGLHLLSSRETRELLAPEAPTAEA